MEIKYLGHSSFLLKGKSGSVVTDPYNSAKVGLKFPKVSANIVTLSHDHDDHNDFKAVEGEPLVIQGPGEYEVAGINVFGIPTFHDSEKGAKRGANTVYRIGIDSVSVVHLGDLGHKLTDEQVERIEKVDILLIPVGGVYTIDAKEAMEVITQLEPLLVIPMHYGRKELKSDVFGELSTLEAFLKEMGKVDIVPQPKLLVTKDKLPTETTVIVLE